MCMTEATQGLGYATVEITMVITIRIYNSCIKFTSKNFNPKFIFKVVLLICICPKNKNYMIDKSDCIPIA